MYVSLRVKLAYSTAQEHIPNEALAQQVYWLVVSASWGTIRLLEARSSVSVNDDGWGFGQILPTFLLVGPVIAFVTPVESFGLWQVGAVDYTNGSNSNPSQAVLSLVHAVPVENPNLVSHGHTLPRANTSPETVNRYDEVLPMTRFQTEGSGQGVEMSSYASSTSYHTAINDATTQDSMSEPQILSSMSPLSVLTVHQLQEQPTRLKVYLHSHYTRAKWIRSVITFTCLQILLATIFFFIELGNRTTAILTFTDYVVNIVFTQPLNVCFAIGLDLSLNRDHIFRRPIFWLPLVLWLMVALDIVFLTIAWGWFFDIMFEIGSVMMLSLLASINFKISGTTATAQPP